MSNAGFRGLRLKEDEDLAAYTTIGIGGPARYLAEATSINELCDVLLWATDKGMPVLVLGGGSNMLVADTGWPGLVLVNRIRGVVIEEVDSDTVRLTAGGGEDWDAIVSQSVDANLQGIECLSGIPGTVGASPIQNIGAYGQEVKDTIEWVEALERSTRQLHRFTATECAFGYRWSRFKGNDRDRYIVTRVAFLLQRGAMPTLRYGDITRYFDSYKIEKPTLADVRRAVLEVRRSKGMVVAPDLPDSRSCGSFFMNPVVSPADAARVREIALREGAMAPHEKMPEYPADDGQVKLSAAWLMERAGLRKGFKFKNVGLSSCHVLAIINCGGGTAKEIVELVQHVKDRVLNTFGIELHPEPVFIGFDQPENDMSSPVGKAVDHL